MLLPCSSTVLPILIPHPLLTQLPDHTTTPTSIEVKRLQAKSHTSVGPGELAGKASGSAAGLTWSGNVEKLFFPGDAHGVWSSRCAAK